MFRWLYNKFANGISYRVIKSLEENLQEKLIQDQNSFQKFETQLATLSSAIELLPSTDRVKGLVHEALWEKSKDLEYSLSLSSRESSQAYVKKHMSHLVSFSNKFDLLEFALSKVRDENGLYLEFGVFKGETINFVSSRTSSVVHGFDSFEGLPEFWRDGFDKGAFGLDGLPKVNDNVRLYKGWFDESLPLFISQQADSEVSFLHVDCDLYSSTKTIFEVLANRIVDGTVIVFDEYFNYDGWENGEIKAFREFLNSNNLTYDYLSYNRYNEQVAVTIRKQI